jgi:hypothetical protein
VARQWRIAELRTPVLLLSRILAVDVLRPDDLSGWLLRYAIFKCNGQLILHVHGGGGQATRQGQDKKPIAMGNTETKKITVL